MIQTQLYETAEVKLVTIFFQHLMNAKKKRNYTKMFSLVSLLLFGKILCFSGYRKTEGTTDSKPSAVLMQRVCC